MQFFSPLTNAYDSRNIQRVSLRGLLWFLKAVHLHSCVGKKMQSFNFKWKFTENEKTSWKIHMFMKRAIFKPRRLNELPRLCIWRNRLNVPVSDQFYKHIIFISINISAAAILCLPSSAPRWKCVVNIHQSVNGAENQFSFRRHDFLRRALSRFIWHCARIDQRFAFASDTTRELMIP